MRHSKNLRAVKKGLSQVERLHLTAIRRNDAPAVDVLRRFQMFNVGLMAEALLRKAMWDPDGFNERERKMLWSINSQFERWKSAVELAFRRHYAVPYHRELDQSTAAIMAVDRFTILIGVIDDHLESMISDRNKTAHAQWDWHLNNRETQFTDRAPRPLNYCAVRARSGIISELGSLIHILAVSEPTFERDFNLSYARIEALVPLVDGPNYSDFVATLRPAKPAE